ncbi:M56 family metallopeptidase [Aliikangiella marina]|uniref:Protein TonB n=1 Tax=Aliikangiella marina TaxID=1712262 RepID=A0A545T6L0_9GAMM|nr:M56 family metallopeptidase [Aliikangiella marina]TQV72861.1 M56 family metallopeptidase [Aliikangiella marina]
MISMLFDFILAKLPGVTVLLVLVLVARHWVLRYLNARIAYCLWLLVPCYLLFPFEWVAGQSHQFVGAFTYRFNPLNFEYGAIKKQLINAESLWLATIWVSGVFAYIGAYLLKYALVRRSFMVHKIELSHVQLESVNIVSSSLINYPAVIGFIQSYLILPEGFHRLSAAKRNMIIEHELCHLARKDYLWNLARVMIRGIFWFHPLVHFADKYVEADQEISCDLAVLKNANKTERFQYAESLVETATQSRSVLLSQWDYFSLTKERVKMLRKYQIKQWHSIVAIFLACAAFWFSGNFALAKQASEEVEPISFVNPKYPLKAAKQGVEGYVRFQLDIDENGLPSNIKIIESTPGDTFDQAAMDSIKQWKFKQDQPMTAAEYTIEFKVN